MPRVHGNTPAIFRRKQADRSFYDFRHGKINSVEPDQRLGHPRLRLGVFGYASEAAQPDGDFGAVFGDL